MSAEVNQIAAASAPAQAGEFKVSEAYRQYVVWFLFLVYVFNFVDRQILATLMEPIKAEFRLTDTQLGLLSGLAFAVFYTTIGIPIARLADKSNRVNIIAVSLLIWSAATAATTVSDAMRGAGKSPAVSGAAARTRGTPSELVGFDMSFLLLARVVPAPWTKQAPRQVDGVGLPLGQEDHIPRMGAPHIRRWSLDSRLSPFHGSAGMTAEGAVRRSDPGLAHGMMPLPCGGESSVKITGRNPGSQGNRGSPGVGPRGQAPG